MSRKCVGALGASRLQRIKESAVRIQIQMQALVRLEKSDVWPSLGMGKKAVR